MSKIKTSLTLLLLLSFFGCSSSKLLTRNEENKIISVPTGNNKSLFYKDGQQAFYLKCEGPSWSECIELAGIACKNKGYDVLEKNTCACDMAFKGANDLQSFLNQKSLSI